MGSDALYNEQALLWAVIRFVCAVTGMGAGSACRAQPAFKRTCRIRGVRADQSAFMRRHMAAEFSMGSRYVL